MPSEAAVPLSSSGLHLRALISHFSLFVKSASECYFDRIEKW